MILQVMPRLPTELIQDRELGDGNAKVVSVAVRRGLIVL